MRIFSLTCFPRAGSVVAFALMLIVSASPSQADLRTSCRSASESCRFYTAVPNPGSTDLVKWAKERTEELGYNAEDGTLSSAAVARAAFSAARHADVLDFLGHPGDERGAYDRALERPTFIRYFRQWQGFPGGQQLLLRDRISLDLFARKANSPNGYRYPTVVGLRGRTAETGQSATNMRPEDISALTGQITENTEGLEKAENKIGELTEKTGELAAQFEELEQAGVTMVTLGGREMPLQEAVNTLASQAGSSSAEIEVFYDDQPRPLQEVIGLLRKNSQGQRAEINRLWSWGSIALVVVVLLSLLGVGAAALAIWRATKAQRTADRLTVDLKGGERGGTYVLGVTSRINRLKRDQENAAALAEEAHVMAAAARTEARVATNLGLPDGWELIGDLPSQADLDELTEGQAVRLRFRHDEKGERVVVFTKVADALSGPDGNCRPGLRVEGIRGLVKPVACRPLNMVEKVRNGLKNHHFVGVDEDGRTAVNDTAAA